MIRFVRDMRTSPNMGMALELRCIDTPNTSNRMFHCPSFFSLDRAFHNQHAPEHSHGSPGTAIHLFDRHSASAECAAAAARSSGDSRDATTPGRRDIRPSTTRPGGHSRKHRTAGPLCLPAWIGMSHSLLQMPSRLRQNRHHTCTVATCPEFRSHPGQL